MNDQEFSNDLPLSQGRQSFEMKRLLHDLKTHQIELEMQNEELRRTEAKLRDTSRRFADLYDFAPIAYLTMTGRGVIHELNLKATTLLNQPRMLTIGRLFEDFVVDEDKGKLSRHLQEVMHSQFSRKCILRLIGQGEQVLDVEMESSPWWDAKQNRSFIRSIVSDISDWKAVEAELRAERDRAEASNRSKSEFLANMSHEMRSPLGVILGFTKMLLEPADKRPKRLELERSLKTIQRNGVHLLSLIDDLLDLAKVEAGQLTIEKLPVVLKDEVLDIAEPFRMKALEKGLAFEVDFAEPLPEQINTDPTRFRQILVNLLSNALKFTADGSIRMKLSGVFKDGQENAGNPVFQLHIDICDTGIGISPEQSELLFRPFSQADASMARRFGGTGLGLSLARRLAMALDGDVALLTSAWGKGSTFRLSLDHTDRGIASNPAPHSALNVSEDETASPPRELEGIEVLIAEDGPDNRALIQMLLEQAGAIVSCADDGRQAVEAVLHQHFDVILMDIQMPELDGYAATRILRGSGCETPIIAITAHALEEERERLGGSDFYAYYAKPLNWAKLMNSIYEATHHRKALR